MKSKLMITHGTVTHPEGAKCKYCEGVKDEAEPYIEGFKNGREETLREVEKIVERQRKEATKWSVTSDLEGANVSGKLEVLDNIIKDLKTKGGKE